METLILLKNWNGLAKGTRIEAGPSRANRLISQKIARRPDIADVLAPKPKVVKTPRLSTQQVFGKKGKKQ